MSEERYLASLGLVCIERTPTSLRFSHFGKIRDYNSLDPDLALSILKKLGRAQAPSRLLSHFEHAQRREVRGELDRLLRAGYVSAPLDKVRIGLIDAVGLGETLKRCLGLAGFRRFRVREPDRLDNAFLDGSDFLIVVGSSEQTSLLSRLNSQFLRRRRRWLLVTLDAFGGTLGPFFGLQGGPCYDCMTTSRGEGGSQAVGSTLSMELVASQVLTSAAVELSKILNGRALPSTYDGYFEFDCFNYRMNYRLVSPSSLCPTCGNGS